MDNKRTSTAGTGIPVRSGIPRPGGAPAAESAIPRPSSRIGGVIPIVGANASAQGPRGSNIGGPMGSYRAAGGAGRSSVGGASSLPGPSSARQAPQSAAPSTRVYGGLAGRISTLSARPVDNGANALTGEDAGSSSVLLDTSVGNKRSSWAAGIGEDSMSVLKRPHLRKLSMDGTSPLLLQGDHPALSHRPESPAYELSVLRTHYDQQLLSEGRKYKKLEEDYEAKCKELDRFNRQRIELLNEWDKQQEQTQQRQAEWTSKRQTLEDELIRLRASNSELSNKVDELTTTTATELQQLQATNVDLQTQLARVRTDADAAKAQATKFEDLAGAQKAELDDLQNALEDEQRMRLQQQSEASAFSSEEGKKIGAELERQTTHLRKLETHNAQLTAENERLGKHASNVELLKEEKRSLETKLRVLDEMRDRIADSESQIRDLTDDKQQWDSLLRSGFEKEMEAAFAASADPDAPMSSELTSPPAVLDRNTLPRYLSSLRGTLSGLEARCRTLTAAREKLRTRNVELEQESIDVDAIKHKMQLEIHTLQSAVSRAEKREKLLENESGGLKKLLETYEAEEKNFQTSAYNAAHSGRIALLESELSTLRQEHAAVTQENEHLARTLAEKDTKTDENIEDVESLRTQVATLTAAKTQLEAQIAGLEASVAGAGKELDDLGKENEMLWLRVGRGEFDQQAQRCLVLAHNPVSQDLDLRRKTLDALKTENAELLKRVEELSALSANAAPVAAETDGAAALVPQSVVQNLRLDIEGLQASIAAKEKALLRLKQVFSAKANEFREAIQSLFGYKVKFLENGKVKLTSTFNRSKNSTTLIFESEGANVGRMNLSGEAVQYPGLVNLSGLREYWLDPEGSRQSVPCFLAALNLELYESCTMAIRRSAVEVDEEEDE